MIHGYETIKLEVPAGKKRLLGTGETIGKKKVAANCFVAAQCPIPTHMAMYGDMGGKG